MIMIDEAYRIAYLLYMNPSTQRELEMLLPNMVVPIHVLLTFLQAKGAIISRVNTYHTKKEFRQSREMKDYMSRAGLL